MKKWIQELIAEAAEGALEEARLDDLKTRYPEIRYKLDYAATEVPFKYLPWVAKQLSKGERVDAIAPIVREYDKLASTNQIRQKDVNLFKTLADLGSFVDQHKGVKSGREQRKIAKKDAKLLHSDSRFVVIEPLSQDAACYYGYNTKWCISAKESENLYNTYVKQGAQFIFVFDKEPPSPELAKLVFAYGHDGNGIEWFDALNQRKPNIDYLPNDVAGLIASKKPSSEFARRLKNRTQGN
jgi:hypothetical protein